MEEVRTKVLTPEHKTSAMKTLFLSGREGKLNTYTVCLASPRVLIEIGFSSLMFCAQGSAPSSFAAASSSTASYSSSISDPKSVF